MIQYPINVYPDNVALDKESPVATDVQLRFTFKGDILMAYAVRIFDYDTGELARADNIIYDYNSSLYTFQNLAFNNDTVIADGFYGGLSNGRKYIMQMMLVNGTSNTAGFNPDIFCLRGTLQEDYTSGGTMLIEDKINGIYSWDLSSSGIRTPLTVTEGANTYNIGTMVIEIDGVQKKISSYDYNTGQLTLESSFGNLPKGTSYQIYCDYLITEQYYFETASRPVVTNMSVVWYSSGVRFNAAYSQNEYKPLKWYRVKMQKSNGAQGASSSVYYDVAQTDRIYSQKIECRFTDDYDMDGMGGNCDYRVYRFVVELETQEGMNLTFTSSDFVQPARLSTEVFSDVVVHSDDLWASSTNAVYVAWTIPEHQTGIGYRVYRLDWHNNYQSNPIKTVVYDANGLGGFIDYTIGFQGEYRYMIVPYQNTTAYDAMERDTEIYKSILTPVFTTNMCGYTLTAIIDTGYEADGKPVFELGDTYKFVVDLDGGSMIQNTDKTIHVGYGQYSSLTSTKSLYLSGTISGMIGKLECPDVKYTDTLALVQAWRKFITQDCQFILRSPKGDVWVVNIIDSPSTEYQMDLPKYPTKFTFSWAECCDINEILVTSKTNHINHSHKRSDWYGIS